MDSDSKRGDEPMLNNLQNPQWRRSRIRHRLVHPVHKYIYPTYKRATNVLEEDWDSLIVLDGCRADLFDERADLSRFDTHRTITSVGSDSQEWIQQTFGDSSYGDIVYVTANPHVTKLVGNSFHAVVDVWEDGFDEQLRTIPPKTVKDAALQAAEQYPNKRLIVHFMQPHHPFINTDFPKFGAPSKRDVDPDNNDPRHVWDALRQGRVTNEEVWKAYGDNLTAVLDDTHKLIAAFDGKTVVTSDHGNAFGELAWPIPLRLYGHPGGMRTQALTQVPWATVEKKPRRTVQDDGTAISSDYDEMLIKDRLANLGYVTGSDEEDV